MLILAPNPLFLNYIAGVLPDLGVERVRQTTFPRLVAAWLEDAMPHLNAADRLTEVLAMEADARDRFSAMLRYKGSLEAARRLEPADND